MTEREYIDATDLRALDCALDALKHIVPENQPIIDEDHFKTARARLFNWREKIAEQIKITGAKRA